MAHETLTKQTVPTNGATETIAIPLDKCFQLDASVGFIRLESEHEIYLCVYNPARQPDGLPLPSGSKIEPRMPRTFKVGENTQVSESDYLVCISDGSDGVEYQVYPLDPISKDLL
jgi:hypothetical protein